MRRRPVFRGSRQRTLRGARGSRPSTATVRRSRRRLAVDDGGVARRWCTLVGQRGPKNGGFGGDSVGNFICQKLYKNATVWSTPNHNSCQKALKNVQGVFGKTLYEWIFNILQLITDSMSTCLFFVNSA